MRIATDLAAAAWGVKQSGAAWLLRLTDLRGCICAREKTCNFPDAPSLRRPTPSLMFTRAMRPSSALL